MGLLAGEFWLVYKVLVLGLSGMFAWAGLHARLLGYLVNCWLGLDFGVWCCGLVERSSCGELCGFLRFGFTVVCCGLCIWFSWVSGFGVVVL